MWVYPCLHKVRTSKSTSCIFRLYVHSCQLQTHDYTWHYSVFGCGQVSNVPHQLLQEEAHSLPSWAASYASRTTGTGIHAPCLRDAVMPCIFLFMALNLIFHLLITLVVKKIIFMVSRILKDYRLCIPRQASFHSSMLGFHFFQDWLF